MNPGVFGAVAVGAVVLGILGRRLRNRFFSASARRHRRKRRQGSRRLAKLSAIHSDAAALAYLRKVDPYAFEELLLTRLRRDGYRVKRNRRYSGDGGIDGRYRASMFGRWSLVQAKRYSGSVRPQDIVAFAGLCQSRRTTGLFVHTGRTPREILANRRHYEARGIQVISGSGLVGWLRGGPLPGPDA